MSAVPSSRLYREDRGERTTWWSWTVGAPPAIYGERWSEREGRTLRSWDPRRSKLGAALELGWEGEIPEPGERWLYLGAASGTTASHVADLVGPSGTVFALERSPRPFRQLMRWVERWPNLIPIFADARVVGAFAPFVPVVDGIYCDIAQPDQVEIVLASARRFLRPSGTLLLALKTSSMGRDATAAEHVRTAIGQLDPCFELDRPLRLAPWHKGHYLIGGRATSGLTDGAPPLTRSRERPEPLRPSRRPRLGARDRGRPSARETARWAPRSGRRGTSA